MKGGIIYIRGKVYDYQLGKEVGVAELSESDWAILRPLMGEYAAHFGGSAEVIMGRGGFSKLYALSLPRTRAGCSRERHS